MSLVERIISFLVPLEFQLFNLNLKIKILMHFVINKLIFEIRTKRRRNKFVNQNTNQIILEHLS